MRILLFVAIASPLLALWPRDQDPASTDWTKEVERACTSPRYGLRLAAARKVAKAGALAVPAVRTFAQAQGLNTLPAALVEAFADDAPADALTLQLLVDWANDRDFYWRAAALRGLALRLGQAGKRSDELRTLCASYHDDPAWLMRTHARFGSALAGDDSVLQLPEADPRARARLPMLLLQQGKVPPLQPLLDALADERTFQEVQWGAQVATEVHKTLKAWLGEAHPLAGGGSFADTATALQAMLAACEKKSGQDLTLPTVRKDATSFAGGIEMLSCKHGDQFVQWTADGVVHLGVDAAVQVRVPAPSWDAVTKERTQLAIPETMGAVVCDALRLRWAEPAVHAKAAPASLPAPVADWLKRLAQAIEEAGEPRLAAALRGGIEQFATR